MSIYSIKAGKAELWVRPWEPILCFFQRSALGQGPELEIRQTELLNPLTVALWITRLFHYITESWRIRRVECFKNVWDICDQTCCRVIVSPRPKPPRFHVSFQLFHLCLPAEAQSRTEQWTGQSKINPNTFEQMVHAFHNHSAFSSLSLSSIIPRYLLSFQRTGPHISAADCCDRPHHTRHTHPSSFRFPLPPKIEW